MVFAVCRESLSGVWVEEVVQAGCGERVLVSLAGEAVAAGFPSPAEEYLEKRLDLNELLVTHPEATFFVRVCGDSMVGAGIHDGDMLVVDRSHTAQPGNVVIACVDGEFTVKRLRRNKDGMELAPENPDFQPMPINEDTDFQIWGVVKHVIHAV